MRLKPNTKEWFEELRRINPHFAMLAEQMIGLAKTNECCTFCGDTNKDSEILDYEMLPNPGNPQGFTFKMCPDCVRIRGQQYGEKFKPLVL